MVAFCKLTDAPVLTQIPLQSAEAGLPLPVAPPTDWSLTEVKTMGWLDVPTASRVPSTVMPEPTSALTTVPGVMVRVAPAGTSIPLKMTKAVAPGFQVEETTDPLTAKIDPPEAAFPDTLLRFMLSPYT